MLKLTETFCAAALAAFVMPAFAAEWMTDFEAAKARAEAEGKMLLVNFTGSDWCGWCIRLKKDVFDKPAFEKYVQDKFVLMEVDMPHERNYDRVLRQRNRELCEQFSVSGFPTIMVMTPAGDVVGGFVGGKAGMEEVRKPLDAALANAAALQAAEAQEGEAKLKALHAIYQQLPEEMRASSSLRGRIVELDTADITGVRAEIRAQEQVEQVEAKLIMAEQDSEAQLAVVDAALREACPQNRTTLLELKIGILLMRAQTEADILAVKATLLEMADADPENAAALRAMAEKRFANPAETLRLIKQRRGE